MRLAIFLSLMLTACCVSRTFAQRDDQIALWTDQEMTHCELVTAPPGVQSVYMFHTGTEFATGSRFSAPKPACWVGATWMADAIAPPFLYLGDTQTDISIVYTSGNPGCYQLPLYLGRIDYWVTSSAPPCCSYDIQAALSTPPALSIVDCNFDEYEVSAGSGVIINANAGCSCGSAPPPPPPPAPLASHITLYADSRMGACALSDEGPGVASVYMFHLGSTTTFGSRFSVALPQCWVGATWMGDYIQPQFLASGNTQTDLSIDYTTCLQPPIYVGRIDVSVTGGALSCCGYTALPAVGETSIWANACDHSPHPASSGKGVFINPTLACPCDLGNSVPVRTTTWGRIKAMYH